MSSRRDFRGAIAQSFLIVVSVLLALAAENARESFNERGLEEEYLRSMADGLRQDTAAISENIGGVAQQQEYARLVLDEVLSTEAPADPERFLLGVESSARYGTPPIADDAYRDLDASGQLGIIRNVEIRRLAAVYYAWEDAAVELWRNRIWYQYGPVAIDVLPFEVQEWAASIVSGSSPDAPTEPLPPPPDLAQVAADVADRLRATPDAEALIKAVVRSFANQTRYLESLRADAAELLLAVEAELEGR